MSISIMMSIPTLATQKIKGTQMNTYDISKLCFRNQVLRLRADQLLLQRDKFRTLRLLRLQLRNLIRDLRFMIPTRLHALLRIPDLLQHRPAIVQIMRIRILLLSELAQEDAHLVAHVRDGLIVGSLAPVRELAGDGDPFLAGGFVRGYEVVFVFDELVELFGELGLDGAAEGGEVEDMSRCGTAGAGTFVGPDGKGAIPIEGEVRNFLITVFEK